MPATAPKPSLIPKKARSSTAMKSGTLATRSAVKPGRDALLGPGDAARVDEEQQPADDGRGDATGACPAARPLTSPRQRDQP